MKTFRNLLMAGAVVALASCGDSTYEVHQTFFYPQIPGGMQFYADQTYDTLHVYSLDSWTAALTQDWLDVTPKSYTVAPMTNADTRLTVTTAPNTTGEVRTASLVVSSYDVISMGITQYPWLNIIFPNAIYDNGDPIGDNDPTQLSARFELPLRATTSDTTVVFRVYQDNATLQSDADWLTPEETTFSAGRDTVRLTVTPNQTAATRTGRLTLTSAGVSSVITVTQPAVQ